MTLDTVKRHTTGPVKKCKRAFVTVIVLPFLLYHKLRFRDFRQISQVLSLFPFSLGKRVRHEFYRRTLASCGDNVTFHFGTILGYPEIRLGNNITLGEYNVLGLVEMGDDVLAANHCSFLSGRHIHSFDATGIPIRKQKTHRRTIRIGRDVWVGAHAVVMESVGEGSVIGAGSVVTKPVEPYNIVAGNPARVIGIRGGKTE